MKPNIPRPIVAQTLIACALLAGAAALLVGPLRDDLRVARARLSELRRMAEREAKSDPTAPKSPESPEDPSARADEIRRRSEKAADSGALFDTLSRLGESCAVRIDRLEPRATAQDSEGSASQGVRFVIHATGSYENLARFIAMVEAQAGFVATERLQLSEATDANSAALLAAVIETTHRAVSLGGATADAAPDAESAP